MLLKLAVLLVVSTTAIAQAPREPIEANSQFAAKMTKSQALKLENTSLKLAYAQLQINTEAEKTFHKLTDSTTAERNALIKEILAQNPGLTWDDRAAKFIQPNPAQDAPQTEKK